MADDPCPHCDDSGFAEISHGGIWTGENVWVSYAICDCECGQDVRRERAQRAAMDRRDQNVEAAA